MDRVDTVVHRVTEYFMAQASLPSTNSISKTSRAMQIEGNGPIQHINCFCVCARACVYFVTIFRRGKMKVKGNTKRMA